MALLKTLSLLLLLLLTLLGLGLGQPSYVENMEERFHRQHVDFTVRSGDSVYCNKRMQKQGMTTQSCKKLNTFIHEDNSTIYSICNNSNIRCKNRKTNCHTGLARVTVCSLTNGFPPNNCEYNAIADKRSVIIACDENPKGALVPVHFDG